MQIPPFVLAVVLSVSASAICAQDDDRREFIFNEIKAFNRPPDQTDDRAKAAYRMKLCKLADSPWLFYRGTNHLYWKDLAAAENLGAAKEAIDEFSGDETKTWLQGDLHADNFGAFDDARGIVVYGLNDFDESLIADYQYDLWRMAISLVLIAKENENLDKSDIEKVVEEFAESYLDALEGFKGNGDEIGFALTADSADGLLKKFFDKTASEGGGAREAMVRDQTTLATCSSDSDSPRFPKTDKLLPLEDDAPVRDLIKDAMGQYRGTLVNGAIGGDDYFAIKDIAYRLGGTGGLSAERYYVLIEGPSRDHCDDLILDIKQQTAPSSLGFLPEEDQERYERIAGNNHARRHQVAYQALVPNPDPLLGWMELPDGDDLKYFSVRQRSPFKDGLRVLDEEKTLDTGCTELKRTKLKKKGDYVEMAKQWGRILAAAHARADKDFDPALIDYSFEKEVIKQTDGHEKKFAELTVQIAMNYAKRVKSDHALYEDSFRDQLGITERCP
jgi:uncharacterized protein (DUF2252 family)